MRTLTHSYRRILTLSIVALAVVLAAVAAGKIDPQKLTLEDLYRVKPFGGQAPRIKAFSMDDHYLAYIWNPIDEIGKDLYIYDLKTGQTRRVTSLDVMKEYDPPADVKKFNEKAEQKRKEDARKQQLYEAQRDFLAGKQVDLSIFEKEEIEALKKEMEKKKLEEAEKAKAGKKIDEKKDQEQKKEVEKEEWEWRDELLKKKEKEAIKPGDLYPGVTDFVWSKKADELIFAYRGDLFRYFPDKNRIERLTMTDKRESAISYTADGLGYYYQDESRVLEARFNSAYLFQLNHELLPDDKFKIRDTVISPDGKWMAILASKAPEGGQGREVQIVNYRKRFAEVTKVPREVSDDKRRQPENRLLIRRVRDRNYGAEPEPAFTIPGGDIWYEFSDIVWSEDSSRYVFTTWEREKNSLKIWIGRASETEKPETILESNWEVGHESSRLVDAKFTPDGKTVVAVLDEFGFLQPQLIDVATKSRAPLIKGNFESYPVIGFSKDGKSLFIISDKDNPSMNSVYKIGLAGGESVKIGKSDGMHRAAELSNSARWLAVNFGNWSKRPEMFLIETAQKSEKVLTASHDPAWEDYNILKPEIFRFKNRHGDMLSAFVFKPFGWKAEDKRPGIVYVYGGPLGTGHTVEADSFHAGAYLFQMYMAAKRGFVTVAVDPRGQSGFGTKFSEANFEQVGRPQVEDLEDLVKYMGSNLGADTGRLGMFGWSFGGFQTQMMLYTSPETFACGIAGAGPTEWENYNSWYSPNTIAPSVRDKPTLRKFSLLPLAKNLKHPLLLVHGMEDPNVLYQDTVHVYKALLEAGKETLVELFLDPEGSHSLGGIVFEKARYKKFEEFFLRHLVK